MHRLPKAILAIALLVLIFTAIANKIEAVSDVTAPTSSIVLNPSSPDGQNGWYISPIDITISADDLESGVASINWKIDGGSLNTQSFSNTLNLVQNPSFEDAGTPIDLWDEVNDDINSVFSQDSIGAPSLGSNSAKIQATSGTWNAFTNQANFAVATPYENMTSSVWIKTSGVTQDAYYKVYVVYDNAGTNGYSLIGPSTTVSGTNDWQKITYNFVASHDDAIGVYVELGIKGSGTVWFDGATITSATTSPSTNFVVSSNGEHTLEYYAIDNAGNEESAQTVDFKIDTKAPSRWTDFTLTQSGNDHTYIVSINVSDTTSGIDVSTDEFQYSIDQGVTWGYYATLTQCNVNFIQNWNGTASVSPNTDGSNQVTITTSAIDFCDNNWADTKYIRFRIYDMAGNLSISPDFAINGAWIEIIDGDMHSNDLISSQSSSAITYLASADETISNIDSENGWYLDEYDELPFDTYAEWATKYPTSTALPGGKLPTIDGKFKVNSDFTIANTTIPNNLSSVQNMSAVVFVDGDLNINANYSLHSTSGIIFIVAGDITVNASVDTIDSFYITDGLFDLGGGSAQIAITGGVQADDTNMKRTLSGNQNSTTPAQIFTYDPKYLIVGKDQLTGNTKVSWIGIN